MQPSSAPPHRLFLLDGMALVYRAHFAFMVRPIINSKGMNTSAVFGFANTLVELLKAEQPTHMALVFDTAAPTARHVEFPDYKAQREDMPEDLKAALPWVRRLAEAFNIPVLSLDGYEADDLIGTLAKRAEAAGSFATYMVTPDKDFAQLVSERSFIYKPGRQGADHEILDLEKIREQWQVQQPEQVIDVLGLWGDASDNIPGVAGIGEKTAKALIARFGSIENLHASAGELKGKQRERVLAGAEQARLSRRLATILTDAPVEVSLDDLKLRQPDEQKVRQLLVELEFNQLGRRLFGEDFKAGRGFQAPLKPETPSEEGEPETPPSPPTFARLRSLQDTPHDYQLLPAEKLTLPREGKISIALDLDQEDPKNAQIRGVALSWKPGVAWYAECGNSVPAAVRAMLADPGISKVGHDLKSQISALLWNSLPVGGSWQDVMLAQAICDPDQRNSLPFLCEALLGYTLQNPVSSTEDAQAGGRLFSLETDAERNLRMERCMERADVCGQLLEVLEKRLAATHQARVFHDIESPLVPVLAEMEHAGIALNLTVLREAGFRLEKQIRELEHSVQQLAGVEFNLNSPKQLGQVLFEKLRLMANPKKTKTGQYMTGEDVLADLAAAHPIVAQLLDYREAAKLKSTYVDALPLAVSRRSGRVHTTYLQVETATGRLASKSPNLQNIPIRTEQGREIRRAFISGRDGWGLLSADYSQIELRVMAALSGDPSMLEAFHAGRDIHAATAARVFAVPQEEVTPEMRRRAKMVNFGIIFGISAFGLSERLGIARSEGQRLIDEYFIQYPLVKQWMDDTVETARQRGYVETVTGRRRYLRDIRSANATVRKAAERTAINTPIQGTAADMIKLAMIRIHRALAEAGIAARMLLQVHDELVFEVKTGDEPALQPLVAACMKEALALPVPIQVDFGTGPNWREAHP